MPKLRSRSCVLLASSWFALSGMASAAASALPDFSGIWRLNDQQSDSPDEIAGSLRAERKREETAAQLPASASSSSTAAATTPHSSSGHGGGHGMGGGGGGGGGHGRGGNRNQSKSSGDGTSPIVDTPPPLLASDSILNVQQDAKHMQVALSNSDQLDARLDGVAQQSLNGSAVVQTHNYSNGVLISMQFDGGTHLDEYWAKSADGHHLTVIEQWTTPTVRQAIVFKRIYDRLDI
jgi:hypothetical protein